MIKVKADVSKNRLYITMSGIVTIEEVIQTKQSIEKNVTALKSGFDVLNDISKFIRGDDSGGYLLKEIIIMLVQKGVNRVVRVVGTSKAGLIQLENHSLKLEQYPIHYLPTFEEAESFLDSEHK